MFTMTSSTQHLVSYDFDTEALRPGMLFTFVSMLSGCW